MPPPGAEIRLRRWARRLPEPVKAWIRSGILHVDRLRKRLTYGPDRAPPMVEVTDEVLEALKQAAVDRLELLEDIQTGKRGPEALAELERPNLPTLWPASEAGYWCCQIVQLEEEIAFVTRAQRAGDRHGK